MSNLKISVKNVLISFLKLAGCILILTAILIFGFNNKSNVKEPKVPSNFVLKPYIKLQNDELHAGIAFAAKIEGNKQPVIVTAMHLFGPDGGLEEDIPAEKLKKSVKKVVLTDAFNGNNCGSVSKVLYIPNATRQNYKNDVAAFLADKNTKVSPLKISDSVPKTGDPIWLAAPVILDKSSKKQKLYKATVIEASDSILSFEYKDKKLVLDAASGAPILNEKGEIVGINISSQKSDNNSLIGVANPCSSFKEMIIKALKIK